MLCQAAETELAGRLRPGLTPEDCESAFVPAAAWMVLAWLQAGEAGVASFTAGDLTIRRTGQGAAELTAQAERLMAPYLVDGGFSFQGVAGGWRGNGPPCWPGTGRAWPFTGERRRFGHRRSSKRLSLIHI